MFRIGEFSRFSRVSVKMLRHYDELGLLVPVHVDPFTNYRYYSAGQLPRLNRILALRDLGFGLEEIRQLLDDDLPVEQLRGMLKLRRAEIHRQLEEAEARLARVESRLAEIGRQEGHPAYEVIMRGVDGQMVAAVRERLRSDSRRVGELFEMLEAHVARYNARAPHPPLMLYHDAEYQEGRQDVEIAVPVNAALPATAPIHIRQLPAHPTMACAVHTGDYATLPFAYHALLRWVEAHGYTIAGPLREAYLRFGADREGYDLPEAYLAARAADFVTELQLPVTKS